MQLDEVNISTYLRVGVVALSLVTLLAASRIRTRYHLASQLSETPSDQRKSIFVKCVESTAYDLFGLYIYIELMLLPH